MQVSLIRMELVADFLISLFIVLEDAIPQFFQDCILACEYCEKSRREKLSQIVLKDLLF